MKQPEFGEVVEAFVLAAAKRPGPVYVGIDPGTSGAIAFWASKVHAVIDIPVTFTKVKRRIKNSAKVAKKTGKKTRIVHSERPEFDLEGILTVFRLLKPLKPRIEVILEKVPLMQHGGSRYGESVLNRAYGMWPLFLLTRRYVAVHQVTPSRWKEALKLTSGDKEASRHKAIALYPNANILRKCDHDRAEALLLIEYLRRHVRQDTV